MAPEQAGAERRWTWTRGPTSTPSASLLYELLTGTTPLERERLRRGRLDEVLRVIREEEPPPPSTRLSTADDAAGVRGGRAADRAGPAGPARPRATWTGS